MRALSYIIALAVVLIGPPLAGAIDSDLPGVGTFTYGGTAVAMPASAMITQLGH